jgi:hypothetical protein
MSSAPCGPYLDKYVVVAGASLGLAKDKLTELGNVWANMEIISDL